MDEAKAEFNWRMARGIALAVCLAGSWIAWGSASRAQAPPAAQAKAQAAQVKAQAAPAEQGSAPSFQLLNAKQGRSIVDAAKDQGQPARAPQDFSHLFLRAYLETRFAYPYANSCHPSAGLTT